MSETEDRGFPPIPTVLPDAGGCYLYEPAVEKGKDKRPATLTLIEDEQAIVPDYAAAESTKEEAPRGESEGAPIDVAARLAEAAPVVPVKK